MYKIINDNTIKRISDNTFIPKAGSNADYEQFLNDIITLRQGCSTLGIGTYIEGETVGVTTDYKEARRLEYPPMQDQLDKIYHSGVNAWKADVKAIKDKYPKTQVGVTTVLRYPSWVDDEIYIRQTAYYISAAERLKQYRLLDGKPEVTTQIVVGTENVWDSGIGKTVTRNVYETRITERAIAGLAATDNRVINDERERAEAQNTISFTPQSIIDANS